MFAGSSGFESQVLGFQLTGQRLEFPGSHNHRAFEGLLNYRARGA